MTLDLDRLREERIYRASAPVNQLIQQLFQLHQVDGRESNRRLGFGFGGALLLFLSCALSNVLTLLFRYLFPRFADSLASWSTGLLALTGIVLLALSFRRTWLDVENRRYELPARLLWQLKEQLAPARPVSVEIDLRSDTHSDKFVHKEQPRPRWETRHYRDPWLSLRGRLVDGTRFHLAMDEHVVVTEGRESSRSMLHYNKRSSAHILLRFEAKSEQPPDLDPLAPRLHEALPGGAAIEQLGVKDGWVELAVRLDTPWTADDKRPERENAVPLLEKLFLGLRQAMGA